LETRIESCGLRDWLSIAKSKTESPDAETLLDALDKWRAALETAWHVPAGRHQNELQTGMKTVKHFYEARASRVLFLLEIALAIAPAVGLAVFIALSNLQHVGWSESARWSIAPFLSSIALPYVTGVIGAAALGIRGARRFFLLGFLALVAGLILFANLDFALNSVAVFVGALLLGAAVSALLPRSEPN
jgi:hypothetical protein